MALHSYKELIVWQRSIELVVAVYKLTEDFPKEEIYGLTSQMRRCSVSIPSNIAEGRYRGTKNDFLHFLRISYSSGAELETQIEIAKLLPKTKMLSYSTVDSLLNEVMRMLNKMIKNFNPNN
ncbi:four helix bundle protein [Candidatus Parcubacteria bacterium]|nr:four helix bundle protein [Patescibacteria group bacterium]MCG2693933.1 four helix bundle protein [Candidatus Parcubacteria bacterium]